MKIILDTHYLIWVLSNKKKLNKKDKEIISSNKNDFFVSVINFWELSLKYSIGKIELKNISLDDIYKATADANINILPLSPIESISYYKLPKTEHKDPFDRMLIWQAIKNDMHLLTRDKSIIENYYQFGLKTV